jgi:hypothetical protein
MTTLPASGYLSDANRTVGEQKQALEDLRNVIAELPGGAAESTLTIASGSVTPTGGVHAIDTEGAASIDDLTNIDFTNVPDGRLLLIHAADAARTVNVKHQAGGTGQVKLTDAADFPLDDVDKWLLLKRSGTLAEEVLRSYGADKAAARAFFGLTIGAAIQAWDAQLDDIAGLSPSADNIIAGDGSNFVLKTPSAARTALGTMAKGKFTITIPAAYINPRASNGCDALATLETTTNKANYRHLAFDAAAAEYAQFEVAFPKSWDEGTIEWRYLWSHPATTTNFGIAFTLAGKARADAEAMDAAFGTEIGRTDTGGTTDTLYWSAWSSALTVASAAEATGQLFQLKRNVADGSDTLAVDARLHTIQLRINLNQENDS